MATLQELKAQSPAYQSMPDEQFADLLYTKVYADRISRDEFDVRVGVGGKAPAMGSGFMPAAFQRFTDRAMDPFGIKDEVLGATQAVRSFINTGDTAKAGQAYADARDRDRAEQAVARQDYGIVPDLVGGLGVGGLMVKQAVKQGVPLATRLFTSAKTGAKFGGAAGVGHSEGGVGERAIGGLYGAGAGAAIGPIAGEVVAPLVGRTVAGLQRGGRSALERAKDVFGDVVPTLKRSTDDRYTRALARQGMTVDDAAAAYESQLAAGKFGKTQLDTGLTPADLGPATARQGRAIATIPGRGSSMAEEFFGERQQGQYGRMVDYLRRALQVGQKDYAKTLNTLDVEMKTAAAPSYKRFYDLKDGRGRPMRYDVGQTLRQSELKDSQLAPDLAKVMQRARTQFMSANTVRDMGRDMNREVLLGRDAILGRSPTYKLTGRRFDSGKQALDDMIEQAKARGQANQVRLLSELKNDLVKVVDRESMRPAVRMQTTDAFNAQGVKVKSSFEVPVIGKDGRPVNESLYGAARDAYAGPAQLKDALTAGRSFMRGDSEMTAAAYKELSTAEKKLFRLGVHRESKKVLGGKALGQDMVNHFRKPNTMETLSEVMSPAKFRQFMQLADLEKGMAQTSNVVRGGSPTANKLADVEDLNPFLTMGRVLKDKGFAGAAFDAIGAIIQKTLQMREVDAHNLARVLFEADPVKVRANFARLQLLYGERRARQAVAIAKQAGREIIARNALTAASATQAGDQVRIAPMDLGRQPLP